MTTTKITTAATTAGKKVIKSWSSTLRLPKSSFPARPTADDSAKYLHRCTDELYSWQRQRRRGDDNSHGTFTLHDGPPYANGSLHVGHALNKILKDIVCRIQLAQGKIVSYVPGWDCHGLPIEMKALGGIREQIWGVKQEAEEAGSYDAVKVRATANRFAQAAVREQMAEFRSWGVMGDWDAHWKTMDQDFELRQLAVFRELATKGFIYRRKRPVYWSPSSRSALAEAELEYRDDHVSTAALVRFPLTCHPFDGDGISAVAWTTTPWTLPANQALAIGEDMEYTIVRSNSYGDLLLASSCVDFVRQMIHEELLDVRANISGSELLNTRPMYRSLFNTNDSDRPLIHADFVKSDAGTGLVHCAPGHGMDDYLALLPLIQRQEAVLLAPVDARGRFTREALPNQPDLLEGQRVLTDGNQTVLNLLKEQRSLLKSYSYTHSSPYDWRTKQPVIVRATSQWFADVSSIRQDAIASLQEVKFVPSGGKARLASFVENRSEWCISRQRAWGVPIPSLYRVESGDAVLTPASINHIMATIAQRGIDAWWSDEASEPAWIAPELLQDSMAEDFRRGTDTMDVWFDSGTSWSQLLGGDLGDSRLPADVYLEGSDQHRGWFQSSLLTRVAHQKSTDSGVIPGAPFRSLITHGFTLDDKGRKMSKSEGNVIEPNQIIQGLTTSETSSSKKPRTAGKGRLVKDSLGADALRMWVASSDFTKDVIVSNTVIKNVHAALHKYRVTFKLLLGAMEGLHPRELTGYQELRQIDQVALHQLWCMKQTVMTAYRNYEFHHAVREINRWVNNEFSGLYVEAIKDSLYCDDVRSSRRREVQTTLYHIWTELQAVLAPLAPLLVEESWHHAPECVKTGEIHPLRREWSSGPKEWRNDGIEAILPTLLATNSAVKAAQERARVDKRMGSSLESFVTLLAPDCSSGMAALDVWRGLAMRQVLVVSDLNSDFGGDEQVSQMKIQLQSSGDETPSWVYVEPIDLGKGTTGWAVVRQPESLKCERCWRYRANGQTYADDLSMEALDTTERERGIEDEDKETRRLCVRCTQVVGNVCGYH